jgi:radical SAM superfamily enzyme
MCSLFTYQDRTSTLVPHERGKYGCPLRNSALDIALPCPLDDPRWDTGGCTTTIATSAGARVRIELDRSSDEYKAIYKQRTATERINSQAKEWGIERPKLRNGQSITNLNTLISVLINLRTVQRIPHAQSTAACQEVAPAPTDE